MNDDNSCKSASYEVQPLTKETSIMPNAIKSGILVVKIPVVLAEVNITIPVEDTITLDKEVLEIKSIRKSVFLTHSRIVPFSEDNDKDNGILYVEGVIKKNIEYVTKTYTSEGNPNASGYIRYSIFQVPFSFTTRINFITELIIAENTISWEGGLLTDELKGIEVSDEALEDVIGESSWVQNSTLTEVFNEEPFTELVKSDIIQIDVKTDSTSKSHTSTDPILTKVTEKVVLNLTLNVLQKQQVKITAI
ncbi:MAG: hypothetical protein E7212_11185 [Clostridium sartagoforme]|nr:hypothetical protein [Clostridium sartagoforme]